MQLNSRILESAGTHWADWQEFDLGWMRTPKAEPYRSEALKVLESEYGASRLFVLKDPRICRLFPFWKNILRISGVDPLIILPLRNPLEVAASLQARDGLDPMFGHLLWLRHVLDAEAVSRGLPRFFPTYDQLLSDWKIVAARGEAAFGIAWPRFSEKTHEEINSFLSLRHRHHQELPGSVLGNTELSFWLRETFRILLSWSEGGERKNDYADLDQIRAELNAAGPAFGRLIAAGQNAVERVTHFSKLETELRRGLAERDGEIARLMSDLESHISAVGEAEAELDALRGRIAQAETALRQSRAEGERVTGILSATQKEVERLKQFRAEYEKLTSAFAIKSEEVQVLRRSIEDQKYIIDEKTVEAEKAGASKAELEQILQERFDEISKLTSLISDCDRQMLEISVMAESEISRLISELTNGPEVSLFGINVGLRRKIARIQQSGLFDSKWYLKNNADVVNAGCDPHVHYVRYGAREGRAPNAAIASLFCAARRNNDKK